MAGGLGFGPTGIAFDSNGDILVADEADGNLYHFPSTGGVAASGVQIGGEPFGLAFGHDAKLYVTRFGAGDLDQIDPLTGAIQRVVATGLGSVLGLATDPISGDLFVSICGSGVVRINPATGASTPYTLPGALVCPDGLMFDPSGTLYVADNGTYEVMRVDRSGATNVVATLAGDVDGIALGRSGTSIAGSLFVNRNDGVLTRIDITQSPSVVTDVASGGSRGDFVAVSPDGYLFATQVDRVIRISPPNFQPAPGNSAPLRYVAFGDSVPYGHGLANPGKAKQSGLDPQMGPSPLAYPSLVAKDLGYSALNLRSDGCNLGGDNLSVSGAASSRANTDGTDDDCPNKAFFGFTWSTLPHKAIDPKELAAANLKNDPPALVTIQVGADDLDFVNCIKAELGIIAARSCVQGSAGSLKLAKEEQTDLDTLTTSLNDIVKTIEGNAPGARIGLINYYQIAPAPDDVVVADGSNVCSLNLPVIGHGLAHQSHTQRVKIYNDAVFLQTALNDSIAAVKKTHPEVTIVDVSHVFDGKAMCTAHSAVYDDVDWRAAHPTADGHKLLASAIEADLRP
jgi:lysophospholipase L1-like esterase